MSRASTFRTPYDYYYTPDSGRTGLFEYGIEYDYTGWLAGSLRGYLGAWQHARRTP